MSEQLFDVVFFGILQPGKNKESVMQNMASLFKTDAKKLAPYFVGGRKVIKGKINAGAAEKYRAALENIGLVIKLEACEISEDTPTAAPAVPDTGDMSLAPPGTDVIANPVEIPAQEIDDISTITVADTGVDVLEHPVKVPAQAIAPISDITLAEVGVNVIENPVTKPAQKIDDLPDITLAEAGADLITNPKPVKKAELPDTSGLSLDS